MSFIMEKKIFIGNDTAGYYLKQKCIEYLEGKGIPYSQICPNGHNAHITLSGFLLHFRHCRKDPHIILRRIHFTWLYSVHL